MPKVNHNFPAGYFSFAELTFRLRWRHDLDDADFNQWHATVTFQVKATNNEALSSPSSSYSFYFSQVQLGKFEYFQNALQVCFWKKGWDNKQWGEVKWKGRDWCLLIGKFVGILLVAYGIMISYCDQYFLVKYSEAAGEGTLWKSFS